MSPEEAIAAVRRGERVASEHSIHPEPKTPCAVCQHWRTLFCNSDEDVVECSKCGRQAVAVCNFDDEYA